MNHLKQIADRLEEYELDAMLLTSGPGEFYAVGFYGEGVVLVGREECQYYTDARYIEAAGTAVSGAAVVLRDRKQTNQVLTARAVEKLGIQRLGFEDGYMTVSEHKKYAQALSCTLVPAQALPNTLRGAKDAEEIALMGRAQEITDRAFDRILGFIRPGMTEQEIAAQLQYDMLRMGAQRMSFEPIVVAGPNGSLPHGIPSSRNVELGDLITMDFGCVYGGYCSDMTRTVALGQPSEEMRSVYETVLQAQRAGIAASRAGVPGRDIDAAARRVIEEAGYGDYFGHSYGHSVGIEIHESPNASASNADPIPAGAVLSAEPGIYLPGRFGVRIEDVLVFTQDGCINLTKSPKDLIVL